jgi:hypothetical protein
VSPSFFQPVLPRKGQKSSLEFVFCAIFSIFSLIWVNQKCKTEFLSSAQTLKFWYCSPVFSKTKITGKFLKELLATLALPTVEA